VIFGVDNFEIVAAIVEGVSVFVVNFHSGGAVREPSMDENQASLAVLGAGPHNIYQAVRFVGSPFVSTDHDKNRLVDNREVIFSDWYEVSFFDVNCLNYFYQH